MFLVRICTDHDFSSEHMKELGNQWTELEGRIAARTEAERLIGRFTFGCFRVKAETKEKCAGIVCEAWRDQYPDSASLPELVITGFERDEDENNTVRQINNSLYGVQEYLRLISELSDTIPILAERNALEALRKQNYLFAVDRGCGFSTLLSSMGHFLRTFGVLGELAEGEKAYYYETTVQTASEEEGAISIKDIISFLRDEENEKSYNIIGLDLANFLEARKFDELRTFLKHLERFQGKYVFAFRTPFLEKRAMDEIEDILSDALLIRTVKVPPLHDCVLMEEIWNKMNETDYAINTDVLDVLLDKIHLEKTDGRFYGFKTAHKIAYETILKESASEEKKVARGEELPDPVICGADVAGMINGGKKEKTGYDALEEMIGMEKITARVREIIAQVKTSMKNEKLDRPCIHMRFTGSPGTGKTTVARVIGQIMREEGILRKGGFFEYTGRDLVAEYVGQTAVKTASICRDSYGSGLFIDEAYSLYDGEGRNNDFGKEALTTLVSEMENHRDDMLIVMAGYTDDMETLMKGNVGLRSRMPILIDFPNYSREQLYEIFMLMVRNHFEYAPELEGAAKDYFMSLSDGYMEAREFSNARFVRNLYERTWSKAALRASLAGQENFVILRDDFTAASMEKEFSEKIESRGTIGFVRNKKSGND